MAIIDIDRYKKELEDEGVRQVSDLGGYVQQQAPNLSSAAIRYNQYAEKNYSNQPSRLIGGEDNWNNYKAAQYNRRAATNQRTVGFFTTWADRVNQYLGSEEDDEETVKMLQRQRRNLQNYLSKYGSDFDDETRSTLNGVLNDGNALISQKRDALRGIVRTQSQITPEIDTNKIAQQISNGADVTGLSKEQMENLLKEISSAKNTEFNSSWTPNEKGETREYVTQKYQRVSALQSAEQILQNALKYNYLSENEDFAELSKNTNPKAYRNMTPRNRTELEEQRQMKNEDYKKYREYLASSEGQADTTIANMPLNLGVITQFGRNVLSGNWDQNIYKNTMSEDQAFDVLYGYVNKDPHAYLIGDREVASDIVFPTTATRDKKYLQFMNDDEIANFNYLYQQDRWEARAYLESIAGKLKARQAGEKQKSIEAYEESHPIQANIESILLSPTKAISLAGQAEAMLTGQGIDPNDTYNAFTTDLTNIRNTAAQNISEDLGGGFWGERGAEAYQIGMSMADFVYNMLLGQAIGGAASLVAGQPAAGSAAAVAQTARDMSSIKHAGEFTEAMVPQLTGASKIAEEATLKIMSMEAVPDTVIEAKRRGLSDGEAFALGIIAGVAEDLTERYSIDALLNGIPTKASGKTAWVKYIRQNAMVEGLEEVGSFAINNIADLLIGADRSKVLDSIRAYEDQGMSEGAAFGKVLADLAIEGGKEFAGGFISGLGMSAGTGGMNIISNIGLNNVVNRVTNTIDGETVNRLIEAGIARPEGTNARKIAEQLKVKLNNDQEITQKEAKDLYTTMLYEGKTIDEQAKSVEKHDVRTYEEGERIREMADWSKKIDRAEDYDAGKTYEKGDFVLREDGMYRLKGESATGEWNADIWEQVTSLNPQEAKSTQSRYGTLGNEIYSDAVREMESKGRTKGSATIAFTKIYDAGYYQDNIEDILRDVRGVNEQTVKAIYEAGFKDRIEDVDNLVKDGYVSAGKTGLIYDANDSNDIVVKALRDGALTKNYVKALNEIFTRARVALKIYDSSARYNGLYHEGTGAVILYLDSNFLTGVKGKENASIAATVFATAWHELTHRLQNVSPQLYTKLQKVVRETMGPNNYLYEVNQRMLKSPQLSKLRAQDEVIADFIGQKFGNLEFTSKLLNEVIEDDAMPVQEKQNFLNRLRNLIRSAIDWFRGNKDNRTETDTEESETARKNLEKVEKVLTELIGDVQAKVAANTNTVDVNDQTFEGIHQAAEKAANNTNGEDIILYSKKDSESIAIKKQIEAAESLLNQMKPVKSVSRNMLPAIKTKSVLAEAAAKILAKQGLIVDVKDFGKVEISKNLLNKGLGYLNTDEEFAAVLAIPAVLKRGIIIDQHPEHKGRFDLLSTTFAAPVIIDGVRMNMGVVVQTETHQNRYKTHRVIFPNGTVLEINEDNKTEATTVRESSPSEGGGYTITSVSEDNISQPAESGNREIETPENYDSGFRPSIKSTFNYAGIDVTMNKKTGLISYTYDGKKIDNVTAKHIKSSGVGAMINLAVAGGNITQAEANKQYKAFADIMNMIMNTQNPDLVWQFVGSEVFSAVKSNSDNQYGTTVDMSTICKKTQDMITAMSEAMIKAERGLTISEVTELQNKINENGMQVPCPVCYVFSRWAGIGSVLDQMSQYQKKYPTSMSMDEIRKAYERLSKESRKDRIARLIKEDAAYKDLVETRQAEMAKKNDLNKQLKQARKEGNDVMVGELTKAVKTSQDLIKEYKKMMDAVDKSTSEASWLMRTRMSETYKPVPANILFDLDAGATLARDYPDSWNYRMTRGAGKGKAILPYSDFRFGALIDGPKNNGKFLSKGVDVLKTGVFNKEQQGLIDNAVKRVKAQNLIGGQRYQSTSDFRYDYALDYLMSFLEAQALGSNLQTYTKVIEYAELIAAVGGDVNLSVMPLDRGYDDDGNLLFSSVTGINVDAAKRANRMYDSAQLILVGINDRHINLALADPEITFVIPWHASGASTDFTQALLKNLGEDYNSDYYQNYEAVQNDHVKKKATEDQKYRAELRKHILKGDTLSVADIAYLENLNASEDVTSMSFAEMREIEKRALKGNKEALEQYLSWSDGILYDLYQKMTSPEYEGVNLSTSQAEAVMPHEYWNKDTTIDNAYVNGFIFRSYCYSLGLDPRFTGIDSAGKSLSFGDFSDNEGYWKTLIDRPMYANDGTYRDQQAVNLNKFQKEYLQPEHRNELWSEYATQMPDSEKARRVGAEYGQSLRASTKDSGGNTLAEASEAEEFSDNGLRYSIREEDPPKKTGIAYKVFLAKNGQLYPPMVANPGGEGTPIGVWLNADEAPMAGLSKTGRPQVAAGGKGTNVGKQTLAYRPGWHLGDIPVAKQFAKVNPETGVKELFPANFVWAECEYAMDVDYQSEADEMGYMRTNADGSYYKTDKYQHSLAGLKKLPKDGYYHYRTNPNPDTVPWVITGAMKVTKILNDEEVARICRENGVEPMQRQGGPINLSEFGLDVLTDSDKDSNPKVTDNSIRYSQKQAQEVANKNPRALTEMEFMGLLGAVKAGLLDGSTYIPCRVCTPKIVITEVNRAIKDGKIDAPEITDHPMIMQVDKAFGAMDDPANSTDDYHAHGLTEKQFAEIMGRIADPTYIFYQSNGKVAVVVNLEGALKTRIMAVLEFDANKTQNKNPDIMNGYDGGDYNVVITAYPPEQEIWQAYKKRVGKYKNNILIYEKGTDRRGEESSSLLHTEDAPFYKPTLPDNPANVNEKFRTSLKSDDNLDYVEAVRREANRQDMVKSLQDEVKALTESNERLKQQFLRNPVDQKDFAKRIKNTIKSYDGRVDAKEVSDKLLDVAKKFYKDPQKMYTELHAAAIEAAGEIVDSALVEREYNEALEVRKYLRTTAMQVSPQIKADFGSDWNSIRQSYIGSLRLVKDGGMTVEEMYTQLGRQYGMNLFPEDIQNPTDMLLQIMNVVDSAKAIYDNPYDGMKAEAIEELSYELVSDVLDASHLHTFADRAAESREALRKKMQKQSQERISKLREEKNQRYEDLKQHYRETAERNRQRKYESEDRKKLLNLVRRLNRMKTTQANRALIESLIGEIDDVAVSITGKTTEKLQNLRDWYENVAKADENFVRDTNIEEKIDRLNKKQIKDMSIEDVRELIDVLKFVENEIRYANKLIADEDRRETYLMAQDIIDDVRGTRGVSDNIFGKLDRYIVQGTLSPERAIHRMTGYVESDPLYKATRKLSEGQRNMLDYQYRATQRFLKWTQDSKFMKDFTGAKAKTKTYTFKAINGKTTTVEITPAMRVSLYLAAKNPQNLNHMVNGGITIPGIEQYRKGNLNSAYDKHGATVRLTPSQIRQMTNDMTAQEMAFARAVHDYFNGMSQAEINMVSEQLKGYSLAQVEDYFPINTDSNFLRQDYGKIQDDGTVEGMGFLKERNANANNPVLLRDVTDVLTQSIQQTSKYVGLAIPVSNMNKLLKAQSGTWNNETNKWEVETSVKKALSERWDTKGKDYIDKLMTDIQNPGDSMPDLDKLFGKIRSNYAQAVLTLNLSVAMKQAASYPTAAAVVGWKPLIKAMTQYGKVDLDLIAKYTPLQWYRTQGFSTQELGDIKSQNKLMANLPKALNWIQGVDLITTRKLWKAAEIYIQDTTDLYQKGAGQRGQSDAYYRAVADIYNQIIEETQPNYTTMQRPELLRTKSAFTQAITMFKTQPFQNFNITFDAIANFGAKRTAYLNASEENRETAKAEYQAAKKKLGWMVTSQAAQLFTFAAMTLLWNLFRGKLWKYKDDDDKMTAESLATGVGKDMASSLFSEVPFGAEVWEFISSKVFGDQYYGFDSVAISALNDMVSAFSSASDSIKDLVGGDKNINSVRLNLDGALKTISKVVGIPFENIENLFNAGFMHASKGVSNAMHGTDIQGKMAYLMLTTDPTKTSGANAFYDLLYEAYEAGDETYQEVFDTMTGMDAFTEEAVNKKMNKYLKERNNLVFSTDAMSDKYSDFSMDLLIEYSEALRNAGYTGGTMAQDKTYAALSAMDISDDERKALWDVNKWGTTYDGYVEKLEKAKEKETGKSNSTETSKKTTKQTTSTKPAPKTTGSMPAKKTTSTAPPGKDEGYIAVNSSMITGIEYHHATRQLDITFASSGRTYTYEDISPELYYGFRDADSKGDYFNAYIKRK